MSVVEVPLSDIVPSPANPRKQFDGLDELARSIERHGVVSPVILRTQGPGKPWQLVAGERRWRAAGIAGLQTIPSIMRELSDLEALEINLTENLQRGTLHPLEEAEGFHRLHEEHALSVEDIAARVSREPHHVYDRLALRRLPVVAQGALWDGHLTPSAAKQILALPETEREAAAHDIADAGRKRGEPLTVRQAEALASRYRETAGARKRGRTRRETDALRRRRIAELAVRTAIDAIVGRATSKGGHAGAEFWLVIAEGLAQLESSAAVLLDRGLPADGDHLRFEATPPAKLRVAALEMAMRATVTKFDDPLLALVAGVYGVDLGKAKQQAIAQVRSEKSRVGKGAEEPIDVQEE